MSKKIEIIDISQSLDNQMLIYPSVKKFVLNHVRDYKKNDCMSLSEVEMSCHTGTHIDSPYHFVKDGYKISELDPKYFFGKALVIEIPENASCIEASMIKDIKPLCKRVLFKTKNSQLFMKKKFISEYIYIANDAAEYLAMKGVKLVGLDYLCIDKYKDAKRSAHKILLGNNIAVLESIILKNVVAGYYYLACFPLKFEDAEAAPCRAVLIKNL